MKARYLSLPVCVSLACLLALSACTSKSAESRLVGTWEIDKEAMKKMLEDAQGEDNPAAALGAGMMAGMSMTLEFKADGKAEMRMSLLGQERVEGGTWKVVSSSGDTIEVEVTPEPGEGEEASAKKAETMVMTFQSDDRVVMKKPEGEASGPAGGPDEMPFVRKKA